MGRKQKTEPSEDFVMNAVVKYESQLIAYAMGYLRDVERSKDVVQDVFIRLFQQDADKVREELKGWLYTVCRNRALDVLRKEKRVVEMREGMLESVRAVECDPREVALQEERAERIGGMVDRLSDRQQEVVRLRFQSGLSYREISKKTGMTTGNVGFHLHHGLRRLRDLLEADEEVETNQFIKS